MGGKGHHGKGSILLKAITVVLALGILMPAHAQSKGDNQQLNMALDYFQSGKYHEALVILSRLDSLYTLNPRFRACTGLCYYYEDDFSHAARILDDAMPQLLAFSPRERSVYYKADADSHFVLGQYDKAQAAYDSLLTLCPDNDKPEAYYRKGFIHIYNKEWLQALDDLQSSLVYYQQYLPEAKARIAQIRNMITGCCGQIAAKGGSR